MNKPVHELTDSHLDCICGGVGGSIEPVGFSIIATLSPSPDLRTIMDGVLLITHSKDALRNILKPL
jgi:hypothetical protein